MSSVFYKKIKKGVIIMLNDVKEIERKLNDGLQRTQEEHEKCYKWLVEFMIANDLSLNELDNFCFTDSNWIFDQIFN